MESSSLSHEGSSLPPDTEPSIVPDGEVSAHPNDDDHLAQVGKSDDKAVAIELPEEPSLSADENDLPLVDDEDILPRIVGRVDENGVYIPYPEE